MSIKIKNNPEHLLGKEFKDVFGMSFFRKEFDFIISYSFINQFMASFHSVSQTKVIVLGTSYTGIISDDNIDNDYFTPETFLKAFSDKNKIKIFKLLLEKEMYVGEIAKSLKLILSTTSYHLDILLGARILINRADGKKLYYRHLKRLGSGANNFSHNIIIAGFLNHFNNLTHNLTNKFHLRFNTTNSFNLSLFNHMHNLYSCYCFYC